MIPVTSKVQDCISVDLEGSCLLAGTLCIELASFPSESITRVITIVLQFVLHIKILSLNFKIWNHKLKFPSRLNVVNRNLNFTLLDYKNLLLSIPIYD
jgi:hypothetical protein